MENSLNLLAIETSTEYLSIAIAKGDVFFSRDCLAKQKHSELLFPMLEEVLMAAQMEFSSINAIAFGAGPGSFTGLRIACGITQGLAYGLGVPVIPVSTLEAIAESAARNKVMVALDARMGEIYHAAFEREKQDWKTILEPSLCKPNDSPLLPGTGWFAAGSGFATHKQAIIERQQGKIIEVDSEVTPHALSVARLALDHFRQGLITSATQASPVYIRNKIALTIQEQAAIRS